MGERAGVIHKAETPAFTHEPQGGLDVGGWVESRHQGTPLPKSRWQDLFRPPASDPPEPVADPPNAMSEDDDFLRRLDVDPVSELTPEPG